jgi:hypothetical protein
MEILLVTLFGAPQAATIVYMSKTEETTVTKSLQPATFCSTVITQSSGAAAAHGSLEINFVVFYQLRTWSARWASNHHLSLYWPYRDNRVPTGKKTPNAVHNSQPWALYQPMEVALPSFGSAAGAGAGLAAVWATTVLIAQQQLMNMRVTITNKLDNAISLDADLQFAS